MFSGPSGAAAWVWGWSGIVDKKLGCSGAQWENRVCSGPAGLWPEQPTNGKQPRPGSRGDVCPIAGGVEGGGGGRAYDFVGSRPWRVCLHGLRSDTPTQVRCGSNEALEYKIY